MSLVEVLCVTGIMIGLAGLAFPSLHTARRAAHQATCGLNLHQLHVAAQLYGADYDDKFPRGKDCADEALPITWPEPARTLIRETPLLSATLAPYGAALLLWRCPLDVGTNTIDQSPVFDFVSSPSLFESCGMSYYYHTDLFASGLSWSSVASPPALLMLADEGGHWHSGGPPLTRHLLNVEQSQLKQRYRYNIVYCDGHVKLNATRRQFSDGLEGAP